MRACEDRVSAPGPSRPVIGHNVAFLRDSECLTYAPNPIPVPNFEFACGETHSYQVPACNRQGLSPHRRGNHRILPVASFREGSIPAQAGKPSGAGCAGRNRRVYPRTGGETRGAHFDGPTLWGLSPHRRGNRSRQRIGVLHMGSIPAQAGKPFQDAPLLGVQRVYPRTGGETVGPIDDQMAGEGLSPHRRGNPQNNADIQGRSGSIPAQAGKPSSDGPARRRSKVYPRTGGETGVLDNELHAFEGLSPHRRGNRSEQRRQGCTVGSIPAQAGKPEDECRPFSLVGVYPRTGGETLVRRAGARRVPGLSPHRRGNRVRRGLQGPAPGSIPAQAGKPRTAAPVILMPGVYPRTGGETIYRLR